jgi:hypothetical protein
MEVSHNQSAGWMTRRYHFAQFASIKGDFEPQRSKKKSTASHNERRKDNLIKNVIFLLLTF